MRSSLLLAQYPLFALIGILVVLSFSNFLTSTKYNDYNWLDNYKNSTFDVNIDTILDSGFLLTQT